MDQGSKKNFVMQEDLKNLFADTKVVCPDIELRKDLTIYLTYWPSEAALTGGNGTHIKPHCIYLV